MPANGMFNLQAFPCTRKRAKNSASRSCRQATWIDPLSSKSARQKPSVSTPQRPPLLPRPLTCQIFSMKWNTARVSGASLSVVQVGECGTVAERKRCRYAQALRLVVCRRRRHLGCKRLSMPQPATDQEKESTETDASARIEARCQGSMEYRNCEARKNAV